MVFYDQLHPFLSRILLHLLSGVRFKTETMLVSMPLKTKPIYFYCFILLILLTGSAKNLFGQSDTIVPVENPERALQSIDLRNVTKGGINLWRDRFSGHWAGVDFGFNLLLNEDYTGYDSEFMNNDVLRSNSLYINFVQQSIGIQRYRNNIGLVTGLGLHFNNYRLDDQITIIRDENNIIQPREPGFENIKKSKLSIFHAVLPLLMEFQIPIDKKTGICFFCHCKSLGYVLFMLF